MGISDRIEKLLESLAERQAMPDDSWRAEWKQIKSEMFADPEDPPVTPTFKESPSNTYVITRHDNWENVSTRHSTHLDRDEAIAEWRKLTRNGKINTTQWDLFSYTIRPIEEEERGG